MPLQIGAEIVAACAILNKVSAAYGLGALFTGHGLTAMQWTTNLISVAVLPAMVWGYFSVFRRRPLRTLVFAHLYILDTFVSLGFTIFFIVYWFAVAGKKENNPPVGWVDPQNAQTQQRVRMARADSDPEKSMAVGQELAMTIVATVLFVFVRFYFAFVLVGYARMLCRKTNLRANNGQPAGSRAAKVQYILMAPFEKFWTGQSLGRRSRRPSFGPVEMQRLEPEDS